MTAVHCLKLWNVVAGRKGRPAMLRYATLTLLTLSVSLREKERTILMEVKGAGLVSPIQITSPAALYRYSFFNGPGVTNMSGGWAQGTIVDWEAGFVASRTSRAWYTSRITITTPRPGRDSFYLPGKGEPWNELDINPSVSRAGSAGALVPGGRILDWICADAD